MTASTLTHGLWGRSAPAAPDTAPLEGDVQADVAVIGAGYTGLSAALHLAQLGRSVVVLEAREIGFGGAGRNVGLVNAGMWVMPEDLLTALGSDMGSRLLDFLGDAPREVFDLIDRYAIPCEAQRTGTLHCAVGQKGLAEVQDRCRQWQARGAAVEVLGKAEAARKIGSDGYEGALWDHRAGTIQPMAYARGLARAALAEGAQIYTGTQVQNVQHVGDGWQLHTDGGTVRAGALIAAGDAYMGSVFSELATQQVILPYFNMATAPLTPQQLSEILPEKQGAWDTQEVLTSFRLDAAGRLIWGSVGALGVEASVHRAWALRDMVRLFPQLKGVTFEHEWFGQIGMTANNLPRLHVLGPNGFAVAGYNGRGIAPGTVCGKALAHHIAGNLPLDEIPLPQVTARPAPMRDIKSAALRVGAALVHGVNAARPR